VNCETVENADPASSLIQGAKDAVLILRVESHVEGQMFRFDLIKSALYLDKHDHDSFTGYNLGSKTQPIFQLFPSKL